MANIKDWFIQIRANLTSWKSDMKEVKTEAKSAAQQVDDEFKRRQIRFNTKLAQMDLNQLKSTYRSLTKQFDAQQKLNVDSKKLDELRAKMDSTKASMKKFDDTAKTSSSGGSGIGSLTSIIGKLGIAFGATEAIRGFANFLNSSVAAAREAAEAEAKLTTTLTTTNRIREISVSKIKDMAASLQKLTGIDDDTAIKDVYSTLAGFKNIDTNDLEKLGKLVADISVGMGQDLKTSADSLGKALESPAEGSRMLRSMNIMLSESQKDLIKKFTESGETAKASGVIMDAISAKYSGQAKAAADAAGGTKQFAASWGDFKEIIGGVLIPFSNSLTKISSDLLEVTTNAMDANSAVKAFDEGTSKVKNLESNILPLIDRIDELKSKSNLTKEEQAELQTAIQNVGDVLPKAVSKWDAYGKALDISTIAAKNFITIQKELLKSLNNDAIKEQEKVWKKANDDRVYYINQIKQGGKAVASGFGSQTSYSIVPFTDQQLKDANDKVKEYTSIMDAADAQIKRLSGESDDSGIGTITSTGTGKELTQDELDKKKETTKAYYDSVKFEDKNYFDWQVTQFNEQAKIYKDVLGDKFDSDKWINEQKKKLLKEQLEWETAQILSESEKQKNILTQKSVDQRAGIKTNSKGEKYIDTSTTVSDTAKDLMGKGIKLDKGTNSLEMTYVNMEELTKSHNENMVEIGNEGQEELLKQTQDANQKRLDMINNFANLTVGSMMPSFDSLIKGQKNIGEAATEMWESFKYAAANMIIQTIVLKGVMAGLNALFPAGGVVMGFLGGLFGNVSTMPSGISAPEIAQNYGSASQNYNNSNNNDAVVNAINRNTNAVIANSKNQANSNINLNINSEIDGLKFTRNVTNRNQRRLNKAGIK